MFQNGWMPMSLAEMKIQDVVGTEFRNIPAHDAVCLSRQRQALDWVVQNESIINWGPCLDCMNSSCSSASAFVLSLNFENSRSKFMLNLMQLVCEFEC
jgi:hypothetical protein